MRVPLASAFLASLMLAGCLSGSQSSSSLGPGPGPQSMAEQEAFAAHPALAGWQLDCTLGSYEHAMDDAWAQLCVARGSHTPGSKAEMWTAVNPKDPGNVVTGSKDLNPSSSPGCVWNGLAVTHDAGKTWKDVTIGGTYESRAPGSPFYGYWCNTDPDFRFTADGDLHYSVEMYGLCLPVPAPLTAVCDLNAHGASTGWKILLATSHDGGDTFPDVITYQPDLAITTDYSRMARSPTTNTVIEAIGSEGGSGCNVLRWTPTMPQSATFTPVVTKDGIPCNSGGGSGVAVSATGTIVLIGAAGVVARSTDDGLTFLDSNPLFSFKGIPGSFPGGDYRITNNVETSYDWTQGPHRNTLYATYAAAERSGDQADIYVRASKDDGRTWGDAVLVNADGPGGLQWMPGVSVAGDGSVHVAYMDRHYDVEHNQTWIDITHAVSVDGGKTWANERVTTKSFDGNLGVHQDGFPFIGDYLGIDCVGDDCWMGFPDSSLGDAPVIGGAHVHRTG